MFSLCGFMGDCIEEQIKDFAGTTIKLGLVGLMALTVNVINVPVQICRAGYSLSQGRGIKYSTSHFGSLDGDEGLFPIPVIREKYEK